MERDPSPVAILGYCSKILQKSNGILKMNTDSNIHETISLDTIREREPFTSVLQKLAKMEE